MSVDALCTGDEIHLTNGEILSCTMLELTNSDGEAMYGHPVIVFGSFQDIRDGKHLEHVYPYLIRGLLLDALNGGAKIVKGVGIE